MIITARAGGQCRLIAEAVPPDLCAALYWLDGYCVDYACRLSEGNRDEVADAWEKAADEMEAAAR